MQYHGVAISCGECLTKTVSLFLNSIKYNLTGQNSSGKVHTTRHIQACLSVITTLALQAIETEYAAQIVPRFTQQFTEEMNRLND